MERSDNGEYETVQVLGNMIEANLMEKLLDEEDISYFIREWHDVNYDGIWVEQKGWGWILGRREDEERIRSIYRERIGEDS